MVAEDKFFAAQHYKVYRRRMPKWTIYMFAVQFIAIALFMTGSSYTPFCPKKYDHGKSPCLNLKSQTTRNGNNNQRLLLPFLPSILNPIISFRF